MQFFIILMSRLLIRFCNKVGHSFNKTRNDNHSSQNQFVPVSVYPSTSSYPFQFIPVYDRPYTSLHPYQYIPVSVCPGIRSYQYRFVTPISLFLYQFVPDCRAPAGWPWKRIGRTRMARLAFGTRLLGMRWTQGLDLQYVQIVTSLASYFILLNDHR